MFVEAARSYLFAVNQPQMSARSEAHSSVGRELQGSCFKEIKLEIFQVHADAYVVKLVLLAQSPGIFVWSVPSNLVVEIDSGVGTEQNWTNGEGDFTWISIANVGVRYIDVQLNFFPISFIAANVTVYCGFSKAGLLEITSFLLINDDRGGLVLPSSPLSWFYYTILIRVVKSLQIRNGCHWHATFGSFKENFIIALALLASLAASETLSVRQVAERETDFHSAFERLNLIVHFLSDEGHGIWII